MSMMTCDNCGDVFDSDSEVEGGIDCDKCAELDFEAIINGAECASIDHIISITIDNGHTKRLFYPEQIRTLTLRRMKETD